MGLSFYINKKAVNILMIKCQTPKIVNVKFHKAQYWNLKNVLMVEINTEIYQLVWLEIYDFY